MNWGLSPGLFDWNANADLDGIGTPMNGGHWLYWKLQYTKDQPNTSYGHGRIEAWVGRRPGALLKIMEYIGDIGGREEGMVFVGPRQYPFFTANSKIGFFNLSAGINPGGYVDVGTIRIWSRPR
jgi:hypothetical protein